MEDLSINKFNIRVYGLVVNDKQQVLLSDEYQLDMKMTKFPGGGLIFGEGTIDCIKREAIEEFGQPVEVIEHFYTTDFFQKGYSVSGMQIISIYYFIKFIDEIRFKISDKLFDFPDMVNGNQSFRWKNIKNLKTQDVTFPIDKKVVELLKVKYK